MKHFLSIITSCILLTACMRNPVTGKQEIALVPSSMEIHLGSSTFVSMQQMEGGPYLVQPEITDYVKRIGMKLAAVSDRPDLPYEFVVLNNSTPNAWTLPGGKIAVNRGLLTELASEAELAAVLSHEIVHAAARHGAQGLERGLLLQTSLIGLGAVVSDHQYGDLIVGGASIGAGLVHLKYSRNAEFEADHYGMKYMAKAGYDLQSAVSLQEMFLRLAENKKSSWLEGLFATHPPSQERVEANRATAEEFPEGGFIGREEYQLMMQPLRSSQAAYAHLDEGYQALEKGDIEAALVSAKAGMKAIPQESQFYGLLGKAYLRQGDSQAALLALNDAIQRNGYFFDFYLQRGLAENNIGDCTAAKNDLEQSLTLLPTAEAHYTLGQLALKLGNREEAFEHFQKASSADTDIGKKAKEELEKLEII